MKKRPERIEKQLQFLDRSCNPGFHKPKYAGKAIFALVEQYKATRRLKEKGHSHIWFTDKFIIQDNCNLGPPVNQVDFTAARRLIRT